MDRDWYFIYFYEDFVTFAEIMILIRIVCFVDICLVIFVCELNASERDKQHGNR